MSIIGSIFVRLGLKSDEFSKGIKQSEGQLSSFKGAVGKIGGAIAGAFTVDKIVQFTKEAYKLAGQAQGVYNAFSRLNRPGLLNDLKEATRGTTDELKLMQTAVQANNFKIPLEELATYLKFATNRAIETGESVDYLVQSIILGIGRKSPLILDNLGISASELREELAKTGDMGKAVGNIINKSMSEAGDAIETSAVKTQKLGAAWKDFMVAVGDSGAVKSTGNIITDTLTSITRAMSDLIKSGKSWSVTRGGMLGGILGPLGAIFGGSIAAGSAIAGQRSKQNKIDAEDASAAKLAKKWADSAATIEEVNILLNSARSDSIDLTAKETQAIIEALMEKKKQLKAQEQEKIAREQTENGIKSQIAALEELRAAEANPEKRAAYTIEIESLKKRLELMTSTNTVVKGSIEYINQQIEAQEKLYNSTNIQSVRDMAAAKKKELEAAKALLEITEKDKQKRDEALKGDIASGYSTQGMGGSFWLKRVEEKNKLEKNLASYSFDPTLYKDKIQQFKEQAAEVDQVANSIHQTITNTMVSSFQALADGLAGISDMDAGQAIASLLKPLADTAIAAGTIIMTTGEAIESLKKSLFGFNGISAIAAGAILVGIGVAARAGLSAIASSGGSSGSSSYSPNTSFSGGSSYSGTSSQYGYASYRAQSVDVNVTGRISGQDIVLASDKYLKNKSR
nr:MAG TPA: Nuclear pore complex protein [Caudoviricetes sp.]